MKAIICRKWGSADDLEFGERPASTPEPNQVRIQVKACALNFADSLLIAGQYQERPAFPFSPGLECAGIISEISEGVTHLQVGQRVLAICGHGGMAEEVCVNAGMVIPIPDNMPYEHGAAFAIAYGTSHLALDHRAKLQPGETLLVHGAAGGVGLTAVEIGKLMGATVIATASTPEKLDLAAKYGADHLINYTNEDFRAKVKQLTGGVDVVYDPVGGDVFDQSLRCLNWEGRILTIGFANGRIPQVAVNYLLIKNISVIGVYWGGTAVRRAKVVEGSLKTLMGWYNAGKLKPHISKLFPLAETRAAFQYLLSRQSTGKVVITI